MKLLKIFAIVATIAALFTACGTHGQSEAAQEKPASGPKEIIVTAEQFNTSGMKLGRITPQKFSQRVHTTGVLDVPPQYKATVSVFYGGTVKKVHLLAGQYVEKGTTLFTLENPDYAQMQQDYLRAKSQLSYLKAEYERQKELLKDNVASLKTFLKAQSDYQTMLADFNALDKKLRLLNIDPQTLTPASITTVAKINAPLAGYVTAVNMTRGQYLSPNETAVTIVSTEHMHLELNVFEKDITNIKKGQPIRFRLPDNGSAYFTGEVFLVGRAVYGADRTINVHGHLHNDVLQAHFIPGMYIEAEILVDEETHPALPADAVVDLDGAHYILVKKSFADGRYVFVQQPVKVGQSNDGYTQILNAAAFADADILINGAFELIR